MSHGNTPMSLVQTRYRGGAGYALTVEEGIGIKGGGPDAQQGRQIGFAQRKSFLGKAQVLGGKLAALLRHGELAFSRLQVALRALGVEPDPGLGTQQVGIRLIRLGLCRRGFPTHLRTGRERNLELDTHAVGIGLGKVAALAHDPQRQFRCGAT
jgi:hypothetical protein